MKKLLPRPLNQILFASPYFVATIPIIGWWAILVWIAATLGTLTGHGGAIDLGEWEKEREDETLEFIIKPLHGRIPEYWYDVILLAVTGLAITLLPGAVVFSSDPVAGLILGSSGLLKAPAYMIGNRIQGTESSELLCGFLLYFVVSFYV